MDLFSTPWNVFAGVDGGTIAVVDGSYDYCHYMQVTSLKMLNFFMPLSGLLAEHMDLLCTPC